MKPTPVYDALAAFHPAVAGWFSRADLVQTRPWPLIRSGQSTLVAAPTGSGKTLTAVLATLDELVQQVLAEGGLPDETVVLDEDDQRKARQLLSVARR